MVNILYEGSVHRLTGVVRGIRSRVAGALRNRGLPRTADVARLQIPIEGGCLDALEFEPYGVLRMVGWSSGIDPLADNTCLDQDGISRKVDGIYRMPRPDVVNAGRTDDLLAGFAMEFAGGFSQTPATLNIGKVRIPLNENQMTSLTLVRPDHGKLLTTSDVFHREDIYGEGPPAAQCNPEVLAAAIRELSGSVLDFGCGAGMLVKRLREKGLDAIGIELDREPIRAAVNDELASYIRFYNGELPLPFRDGQFSGVIATEVIEHIPNYRDVLRALRRITARRLLVTVPDMASIPACFAHGVVPWHLLEANHVNFFTYQSLTRELRPLFGRVRVQRINNVYINGTFVPGSLLAVCDV